MIKKVIITIPHSYCLTGTTRSQKICDMFAEEFSNLLEERMEVTIFKSYQNRSIYDDNRPFLLKNNKEEKVDWLYSKLHKELDEEILRSKKEENLKFSQIMVIDLHSFPDGDSFDSNEVAILDNVPYQQITQSLLKFLQRNGVKSNIYQARYGYNAILDTLTGKTYRIPTILLEMNEKFIDDSYKKRKEEIADLIAEFIKSLGE